MCGRYVITSAPEAIRRLFGYLDQPNFPPRYNVAPTQGVPIVRLTEGKRQFALVRWGLIPSWVKDPRAFSLLINARGETVNEKPAFRNAMKRRRCLFPADGFYEWQALPGKQQKQPWFVRRRDREPLAFAGLWAIWHDRALGDEAPRVRTCTIITTEPNDLMRPIHDRMPVILPESVWDTWLDPDNRDVRSLGELLVPAPSEEFERWPVTTLVNKPVNNGPELLEPAPVDSG